MNTLLKIIATLYLLTLVTRLVAQDEQTITLDSSLFLRAESVYAALFNKETGELVDALLAEEYYQSQKVLELEMHANGLDELGLAVLIKTPRKHEFGNQNLEIDYISISGFLLYEISSFQIKRSACLGYNRDLLYNSATLPKSLIAHLNHKPSRFRPHRLVNKEDKLTLRNSYAHAERTILDYKISKENNMDVLFHSRKDTTFRQLHIPFHEFGEGRVPEIDFKDLDSSFYLIELERERGIEKSKCELYGKNMYGDSIRLWESKKYNDRVSDFLVPENLDIDEVSINYQYDLPIERRLGKPHTYRRIVANKVYPISQNLEIPDFNFIKFNFDFDQGVASINADKPILSWKFTLNLNSVFTDNKNGFDARYLCIFPGALNTIILPLLDRDILRDVFDVDELQYSKATSIMLNCLDQNWNVKYFQSPVR